MDDLISRKALLEAFGADVSNLQCWDVDLYDLMVDEIEDAPSVDAEPVRHGRWEQSGPCNHKPYRIKNTDRWTTYRCSGCGYSAGRYHNYHYCPNCGSKMDLEEPNE